MINKWITLLIAGSWVNCVVAQTPQIQPAPGYANPGFGDTNQLGAGGLSFSNRVGQTFSPEALAAQLQNLRNAVDQTLPILTAFNENYSNAVVGGNQQTVGGALSGIVSDALRRHQGTTQTSSTENAFAATNLLSVLHGLLSTNSTGTVGAAPNNAQDLIALQSDLQPVVAILQRLNVSPTPTQSTVTNNNGTGPLNSPNGSLTPTGR